MQEQEGGLSRDLVPILRALEEGLRPEKPVTLFTSSETETSETSETAETTEDSGSDICCRVCLENTESERGWIDPCLCSGSQRWIHVECLEKWRLANTHPDSMTTCPTCCYEYQFRNIPTQDRCNDIVNSICLSVAHAKCCFIITNVIVFAILMLMATELFDPEGKFLTTLLPFVKITSHNSAPVMWFLTLISAISALYIGFFLLSLVAIKKKKLYLSWVFTGKSIPLSSQLLIMGFMTGVSYILNVFLMFGCVIFTCLLIVTDYIEFIGRLHVLNEQVVISCSANRSTTG